MLDKNTLIIKIGRNRSGESAGCVDMEIATNRVEDLSDYDFEELLKTIKSAKDSCIEARHKFNGLKG